MVFAEPGGQEAGRGRKAGSPEWGEDSCRATSQTEELARLQCLHLALPAHPHCMVINHLLAREGTGRPAHAASLAATAALGRDRATAGLPPTPSADSQAQGEQPGFSGSQGPRGHCVWRAQWSERLCPSSHRRGRLY